MHIFAARVCIHRAVRCVCTLPVRAKNLMLHFFHQNLRDASKPCCIFNESLTSIPFPLVCSSSSHVLTFRVNWILLFLKSFNNLHPSANQFKYEIQFIISRCQSLMARRLPVRIPRAESVAVSIINHFCLCHLIDCFNVFYRLFISLLVLLDQWNIITCMTELSSMRLLRGILVCTCILSVTSHCSATHGQTSIFL